MRRQDYGIDTRDVVTIPLQNQRGRRFQIHVICLNNLKTHVYVAIQLIKGKLND